MAEIQQLVTNYLWYLWNSMSKNWLAGFLPSRVSEWCKRWSHFVWSYSFQLSNFVEPVFCLKKPTICELWSGKTHHPEDFFADNKNVLNKSSFHWRIFGNRGEGPSSFVSQDSQEFMSWKVAEIRTFPWRTPTKRRLKNTWTKRTRRERETKQDDNLIKDDKVTMQHKMHDLVSSLTEVVSVTAAVQGVVWVLVLTVVTLYAMGILTTRLYHVGK